MIKKGTRVQVIDNSGAAVLECIHVSHPFSSSSASVGNFILGSVKKLKPSISKKRVKKGQVVAALIVSVKKDLNRKNGVSLKCKNNFVTTFDKVNGTPLTNRLTNFVCYEVRKLGFSKLVSLAKGVI